jgi:protein-disulfide isomerase
MMLRTGCRTLLAFALISFVAAGTGESFAREITDLSEIRDVDFTGLSETQKQIALKIMNQNPCNCGCRMTIAECRVDDHSCRRSLIFARTILDALREGKSEAEVVVVLKAKTDTFVEARPPEDTDAVYDIDVTLNPVRGPVDAPVSIIEFSDFQCPYCAGVQATLNRVLAAFPNDVRLVFKQYPLNIHQYAQRAAVASLAAQQQGRFWEMHDKMFQNFTAINEENLIAWARELGLDMVAFEQAMHTGQYDAMVRKDMADGAAAHVLGTPTLFVNGKRVNDRSFEGFRRMIQEALATRRISSRQDDGN